MDKLTLCLVHCSSEKNCSPKGLPSFGFPDYLLQTLKLIKIFISKINSAKCEDKIKNLLMPISLCKMKISQTDIHCEEITQSEEQIKNIINSVEIKEKPVVKQNVRKALDDGPRHNNDKSDLKEIKIIPTMDELTCELEPYLPTEMNSSNWYENENDSYFDYQFRLLREDTPRSFRRAVQYFLLQKVGNNQISMQCKDENQKKFATIRIYHDVSIYTTSISSRTGDLNFHVLFDESRILNNRTQPKNENDKYETSKNFWQYEGSKLLQTGSLVCLIIYFNNNHNDIGIIPCIIESSVFKKPNDIPNEYPVASIILSPLVTKNMRITLNRLFVSNPQLNIMFLIEVRGHFFVTPYKILKTLQNKPRYSIPLLKHLNQITNVIPKYLENKTLNFSSILKPDIKKRISMPIQKFIALIEKIKDSAIEKYFKMDRSQINAFINGISQSVSLIQGPPGTGKSYVGAQIVYFLLNQSFDKSFLPILCICNTSQALDQFLIDLKKTGVPTEDIVRIGSRSPIIDESLSLMAKAKAIPAGKDYNGACSTLEQLSSEVKRLFTPGNISSKDVIMFMLTDEKFSHGFNGLFNIYSESTFTYLNETILLNIWLYKNENKYFPPECDYYQGKILLTVKNYYVTKLFSIAALNYLYEFPWNLSRNERSRYFDKAVIDATAFYIEKDFNRILNSAKQSKDTLNRINQSKELTVLRKSKVIGITTSGCDSYHELIQQLNLKVIICEVAGEDIESHILASLTKSTEHLILIGDYQQLRPKKKEFILSSECNEEFKLDISLFERLAQLNQSENDKTNKLATLNVQRRMRPSISKLIKDTLYPNLENHENVCNYPDVQGFSNPLWFFDIKNSKEKKNEFVDSFLNKVEAEYIIHLAKYLIHQGYTNSNDLTILTPYLGQLLHIRKLLQEHNMKVFLSEGDETAIENLDLKVSKSEFKPLFASAPWKKFDKGKISYLTNQVRVSTIDNFQGEESKIVLISLVRSNNEGNIGFLKTPNRVNVMLSRAKHGMIIVGSSQTFLKKHNESLLGKVIQSLKDDNLFGDNLSLICNLHKKETKISHINELKLYSVDGGCDKFCNSRLPCGHKCPRKCHPDDLQHKKCLQPCVKKFKDCEHKCKKQCYEPCICEEHIKIKLPCSHYITIKCREKRTVAKCRELIAFKLPYCKHIKNLECPFVQENKYKWPIEKMDIIFRTCREKCGYLLDCGHECKTSCMECVHGNYPNKKTLLEPCKVKTPHKLKCKHDCVGTCGHSQKECPPCPECGKIIRRTQHHVVYNWNNTYC